MRWREQSVRQASQSGQLDEVEESVQINSDEHDLQDDSPVQDIRRRGLEAIWVAHVLSLRSRGLRARFFIDNNYNKSNGEEGESPQVPKNQKRRKSPRTSSWIEERKLDGKLRKLKYKAEVEIKPQPGQRTALTLPVSTSNMPAKVNYMLCQR